eukprot:TRINITY_DN27326_c0_g1_i1.p1 TRINITY_DN27326_c0_g1~~TRINITY_DN27326_c0_g1_i1.p1  ORF type:complete len:200 (+),score=53.14 TRINITY_DN27326_c0_g1_i1:43-642(+)
MPVRGNVLLLSEAEAAIAAMDVSKLSRKERKQFELRKKLGKTLDAISRVEKENEEDPSKPRQRTSLTGFWRKRKEAAKSCVFVGNMPLDISEREIRDHFSEIGEIVDFRWLPATSASCITYIQFESPELAEAAVALPAPYFRGHTLRINLANDNKERKAAINKRTGSAANLETEGTTEPAPPVKKQRIQAPRNKVSIID